MKGAAEEGLVSELSVRKGLRRRLGSVKGCL